MKRIVLAAALMATAAMGCAQQEAPAGDQTQETLNKEGKNDGIADHVTIQEVDSIIWSEDLKGTICKALVAIYTWQTQAQRTALQADCPQFQFRVVETTTSKLYAHLDDFRPITLGMKVKIVSAIRTWDTTLTRQFGSDFAFRWQVVVHDVKSEDWQFVKELAEEVGEFPASADEQYQGNLRSVSYSDLDTLIHEVLDNYLSQIDDDNISTPEYTGCDISEIFEIVKDGRVLGYAVSIEVGYDHPLFDGAGVALYLMAEGEPVAEMWWDG